MPKVLTEDGHVEQVRRAFASYNGLEHLPVRRCADLVVVESGQADDPVPHARFRRVAGRIWVPETATHTGRRPAAHATIRAAYRKASTILAHAGEGASHG
jgi:hypothetical protein